MDAPVTSAAVAPDEGASATQPLAPTQATLGDGVVFWQFRRNGVPLYVVLLLDSALLDDQPVEFAALRDVTPTPDGGPLPWELALRVVDTWAELRARGKGRTGRRLLRLVSELQWPTENAFFRSKFDQKDYCYLETHFSASASLPSFGRLYISYHAIAYHVSATLLSHTWRRR